MYGVLLTFGFIMMTPQLFINYKMKSVAHLPWRMMTYKVPILITYNALSAKFCVVFTQ